MDRQVGRGSPNGQTPPTGWPVSCECLLGAKHRGRAPNSAWSCHYRAAHCLARRAGTVCSPARTASVLAMRPGSTAKRLGRRVYGRRGLLDLDQRQVGRVLGEPGAERTRGSFADQVQRDLASRRVPAMLEEDRYPASCRAPARHPARGSKVASRSAPNADARACRRGLRHMRVERRILRCDPLEEGLGIAAGSARGILLDQQRGRCVPAEVRQQSCIEALLADP